MRRNSRLPMEELAPYLFELPHASPPHRQPLSPEHRGEGAQILDWSLVFGNANPVEIEVGFGKGLFLVNAGAARPQTNFFGIEIERKYALFTATRLAKRGLGNVKVAACDARRLLGEFVDAGSAAAVHVYFPDPWWKNRHRKRRLLTETFASECTRVLAPGGDLHLASDVQEYFAEAAQMLAQVGGLTSMAAPEVRDPRHDMDFLTNFERKYRKAGRPIYRGRWRKM